MLAEGAGSEQQEQRPAGIHRSESQRRAESARLWQRRATGGERHRAAGRAFHHRLHPWQPWVRSQDSSAAMGSATNTPMLRVSRSEQRFK